MAATFNRIRIASYHIPTTSTTLRFQALRFYDKQGKQIPYTISGTASVTGTMTFNGVAHKFKVITSHAQYSTSYYPSYAFSAYASSSNKTFRTKAVSNASVKPGELWYELVFDEPVDSRYLGRCSLINYGTSATGSYARTLHIEVYMGDALRGEAIFPETTSNTAAIYCPYFNCAWKFIVAKREGDKIFFLDPNKKMHWELEEESNESS